MHSLGTDFLVFRKKSKWGQNLRCNNVSETVNHSPVTKVRLEPGHESSEEPELGYVRQ